jgi:ATP-dependent Clp protease ATP-binding subunit ClpC
MPPPPADILGRDLNELRRGLRNPEKANVALLAEPGTGKTAYVQGFAYDSESLKYYLVLEVNPERLIEKTGDRDNALLTGFNELLDEAARYSRENNVIIVLFVDEFHKMMQISPSLMESLKPRLEKSALNGFRLIAATTFQEYNETIAQNRALDQRFLQIKLSELPKDAVLHVLENRARQHGVYDLLDKGVLDDIYIESKRILMSNAQPRASIDILNSMIGDIVKSEHMAEGKLVKEFYTPAELGFDTEKVVSRPLLKRVIKRAHGIDIDNQVDVKNVINALQGRLFNQDNAIEVVVHLLEMAAHGFSELDRPKFSFLSTGTTGVGKTEMAKIISETMMIPLKRFDMSRYGDPKMAKEFADTLFQAAWSTPNAYILIDEVEKSSKRAMNILLQVLDDARLTDSANPDRVASFTGCIINLTTNVGSEVYQNMKKFQNTSTEADQELVYKALCNAVDSDGKPLFETAVLGRLDEIVPFHPLPVDAMEKIAMRTLTDAIESAQTNKRKIVISKDIIPYIVKDRTSNDTERGGARDAKRNVRNLVVQQLAHYMTYAEEEVPVIIYLKGRPRFKYSDVADPLNAHVAIMECWPVGSADIILKRFSDKLHKPLINRGLYFPKNRSIDEYAKELASLITAGHFQFKTEVNGETVSIKGV